MLTTPHAAAGITLGAITGNPILAIPAALVSHYLLDMVPHWQETLAPYKPTRWTYIRIPLDIVLAVGLTTWAAYVMPSHASAIWTGAIAANIADLDSLVVLLPSVKRGLIQKYWDWHCRIQRETSSLWGLLPQVGLIVACLVCVEILP